MHEITRQDCFKIVSELLEETLNHGALVAKRQDFQSPFTNVDILENVKELDMSQFEGINEFRKLLETHMDRLPLV